MWVFEQRKIVKHYLRGWFTIDIGSIMPFDTVGVLVESDAINQLKIVRIIRLFRWGSRALIGLQYR